MLSIPTSQLRADIRKSTRLWRFLKLRIKRSDMQPPWSAVHCWNESRWQTVCVAARACTRWWSPATRTLIRPSKPIVSVCSGFKGNTGQPGKKKPTHSQMLQFAKGLRVAGIHRCAVKTLSWILQKHVHLNKQAAGAKCPSWEALKCCFVFFFARGGRT